MYNGWTNYETWLCKSWIDNDEGVYCYFRDITRDLHRDVRCEMNHAPWAMAKVDWLSVRVARQVEEWVDEQAECAGNTGFICDLLTSACKEIDYRQIADALIEEHCEGLPPLDGEDEEDGDDGPDA